MIDREGELEYLTHKAGSGRPELIVMWGRRRLGKTTVLKALCEATNSIYFLATQAPNREQLARLGLQFAEFFTDPLLEHTSLPSWEDALLYLDRNTKKRTIFVVDEFPYLIEADPAVPSRFQLAWDQHLSRNPNIMVVLNGSSISMMEEQVLQARSPLYGRRTGQWQLEPFTALQLDGFFPGRSLVELIELFSVVGGVPYYCLQFDISASLEENIKRHILAKGSVLYQEVPFLLRGEVREPRSYFPILAAIASGAQKFGEISSKTGLDKANLGKYLATLQELRLVRRQVPVTETAPTKSRKGLYVLDDPFVQFWLRYAWPNLGRLELDQVEEVWRRSIAPDLPGYLSFQAENALARMLSRGSFVQLIGFYPQVVGRYWDKNVELDLVGLDRDNRRAVVGEVKWSGKPLGGDIAQSLRARTERVAQLADYDITYALFARTGFTAPLRTNPPERFVLIDLNSPDFSLPRSRGEAAGE